MTKDDLRTISDLFQVETMNEKVLAKKFVLLNPTYEKERNHDRDMIMHGISLLWIAIKEKYRDVWESVEE